jgi:YHS domain-containing protein
VFVWLTVRRGAKDPVCRMRVDRYRTHHKTEFAGREYYFCSAGCQEEFETKPDHYAHHAHGTRGNRPRGLLRSRA